MGLIAPTLPTTGQNRGSEEIDVLNTLIALVNVVNGGLDDANMIAAGLSADSLSSAVVAALGLTDSTLTRRGKSIISTEESRTNVAYGPMPTPDRVSGITLPTDGLICVLYQGMVKNSGANLGRAAVFVGSNQLKQANHSIATPQVAEWAGHSATDTYQPIFTTVGANPGGGLMSASDGVAYTGDVTTGQIIGSRTIGPASPLFIFADAGTYDISVQFKSAAGSVTVKNRKLWVWTMGF